MAPRKGKQLAEHSVTAKDCAVVAKMAESMAGMMDARKVAKLVAEMDKM